MANSSFATERLRSLVERIERLEEEKAALAADVTEIYAEAKGLGFYPKYLREIVKERKLDRAEQTERQAILDLYRSALGMAGAPPIGEAATIAHDVGSPVARKVIDALQQPEQESGD